VRARNRSSIINRRAQVAYLSPRSVNHVADAISRAARHQQRELSFSSPEPAIERSIRGHLSFDSSEDRKRAEIRDLPQIRAARTRMHKGRHEVNNPRIISNCIEPADTYTIIDLWVGGIHKQSMDDTVHDARASLCWKLQRA